MASTTVASFQPGPIWSPHEIRQDLLSEISLRRANFHDALAQLEVQAGTLADAACRIVDTLGAGGRVLVAGNGGSAAEAQHFAGELVGRFLREREPYAVMALSADSAILTAVANDYGYAEVFARQVGAFGRPGDLLIAFSTSGMSENLLRAAEVARQRNMGVIAITGQCPSSLSERADLTLHMPAATTPLIQELQMVTTHLLCGIVECELASGRHGTW